MTQPPASKLPAMNRDMHRAPGFTLVELMVTITVAAILMALAVPAFRTFLQNDRLMTQASSLTQALYLGRAEAVKQDVIVVVCASANGATCSNDTVWETGWIVLSLAPGTTTPVQVVPSLSTGTTLRATGMTTQVAFQSTGSMTAAAPIGFTLCDSRGAAFARYVQVNVTGNIVASPNVGVDLNNVALACP